MTRTLITVNTVTLSELSVTDEGDKASVLAADVHLPCVASVHPLS